MSGRRVDGPALYQKLRTRILSLDPSSVKLFPTAELPHVYGVVMDLVFPNGPATFVVMADGTTSLYRSAGGSIIGGGFHQSVVQAGRTLLAVAEARLTEFEERDDLDLPAAANVRITLLTYTGRVVVEIPKDDRHSHPAEPVFRAINDVITEFRIRMDAIQASRRLPPPSGGATLLMRAARVGDVTALSRADPTELETRDDDGYTALMYAANVGQDDAVRELLRLGANPNAADNLNSTPLMFAAQHDHLEVVRQFAGSRSRSERGRSRLHAARLRTAERLSADRRRTDLGRRPLTGSIGAGTALRGAGGSAG